MTDRPEPGLAPTYSLLALASLLCSLASVMSCLAASLAAVLVTPVAAAAILVLPLLGLTGVVLGVLGLRAIDRSSGAVVGRVPAVVGLFVGLMSAVLQGTAAGSALATYVPVKRTLTPLVERFIAAAARPDLTAARACLGSKTSTALSDERLTGFAAGVEARAGGFRGAEFGVGIFLDGMRRMREATAHGGASGPPPDEWPRPIELVFDRARAVAYVYMDEEALHRDRVLVRDLLVVMPDGSGAVLLPDGPASAVGRWLGVTIGATP